MRHMRSLLLALVFILLITGAAPPIPLTDHTGTAEDPWPVYHSDTLAAQCNPYPDHVITSTTFQLSTTADFTTIVLAMKYVNTFEKNTPIKIPLRPQVDALEDGIYYARIKVASRNGVESAWSDPMVVVKNWVQPEPPGGCFLSF